MQFGLAAGDKKEEFFVQSEGMAFAIAEKIVENFLCSRRKRHSFSSVSSIQKAFRLQHQNPNKLL